MTLLLEIRKRARQRIYLIFYNRLIRNQNPQKIRLILDKKLVLIKIMGVYLISITGSDKLKMKRIIKK